MEGRKLGIRTGGVRQERWRQSEGAGGRADPGSPMVGAAGGRVAGELMGGNTSHYYNQEELRSGVVSST